MAETEARDRRALLLGQPTAPPAKPINAIDYVEIRNPAQTQLRVHFLLELPVVDASHIKDATITGGDTIPSVTVREMRFDVGTNGRPFVDLFVDAPGDFSLYLLTLEPQDPGSRVLDRYFDQVRFTFKAGCPSTLDCEPPPHECPPADRDRPQIDYLAKDFESFRRALLEMSAVRYPAWQERSEADFGVMFAEALSSIADDLSYLQDRIAAEGWIETATERRSIVRLARLVDYEPRVPTAARTLLEFRMEASNPIPPGTAVAALSPDGELLDFETGTGLADSTISQGHPAWNDIEPWWFDDADRCLPRGATEMWVERPAIALAEGQLVLIDTAGPSTAHPSVRQLVTLTDDAFDAIDPLVNNQPICRLRWGNNDALRVEHDLTRTRLGANLVPATHGRRHVERFEVRNQPATVPGPPSAVRRTGANRTPQYLYPLRAAPLAWLAQDQPDEEPRPEIEVAELRGGLADAWTWKRSLLGAKAFEKLFAVDPMRFRALDRDGELLDYDGDDGDTVRFGDGMQGSIPEDGMVFEVTFRVGGGARGNVAAGAITRIDPATRATYAIASVTNPFPAVGGRDEEPDAQVRELAPQKFRAKPLRAVRAEDYEAAAESLAFVQRAGTRFRYTGSWLSVFTSVDPRNSVTLEDKPLLDTTELLDRRRLAGYESFVLPPRFASLDVEVEICVRPEAFRSDVTKAVLIALDSKHHLDGTRGFFHPDHFTFGVPLERSALEAAVQDVHGVDGVVDVRYRRRGHTPGFVEMPDAVEVGADEIVRVENDANRPERGSLRVVLRGGK